MSGRLVGEVLTHAPADLTTHDGCCDSPWGEQAYVEPGGRERRQIVHLELEHPRPLLRPVQVAGQLGVWTLPADVAAQVEVAIR